MLKLLQRLILTSCFILLTLFSSQVLAANKDIVILYTNDIHCAIDDNESLAGLVQYKKDVLSRTPYVALVDAGDAIQGSPIGKLSNGEAFVRLMNAVCYDFAVPGNHEFDYGMERFFELGDLLSCGYYSSNFLDAQGKAVLPAYKIMSFGNKKVAFIGATTPQTLVSSTPIYFQDGNGNYIYSFCEDKTGAKLYANLQESVNAVLDKGVDYVVLVAHLGMDEYENIWSSEAVAKNVSGIDIIIDGHSHDVNPATLVEGKNGRCVLITQTGTKLANIGQLTISSDGIISSKLINGLTAKDPAMEEVIDREKSAFEKILQQPLGETLVPLYVNDPETGKRMTRNQECNMANLVVDAYRKVYDADIAFLNGGSMRKGFSQGVFTYKDVFELLPFGDIPMVIEATGQQVLNALEMGVNEYPRESGGFLHVSGLTYEVDTTISSNIMLDDKGCFVKVDGAYRVQNVLVAGKPLELERLYKVAGIDYILKNGGNGMVIFSNAKVLLEDSLIDADVFIEYVQNHLNAKIGEEYKNPYGEGRIKFIK